MPENLRRCQSCSIPLTDNTILGIEKDGSPSREYCIFCFNHGTFTEPEITIEQMVEKCSVILSSKSELSKEKAKSIMNMTIPQLKRWQH